MQFYSRLLDSNPLVFLLIVGLFASTTLIVPFFIKDIPDFADPVLV